MIPSLRASLLLVPLAGSLLFTPGCGSGGGGGSAAQPAPAPATTVVNGVAFAAHSDVLSETAFGESFGMRTFRGFSNAGLSEYRTTTVYTGSTVGGVQTISARVDFVDATGQSITDNILLQILRRVANSIGDGWAFAKAEDGWIYWVGLEGQLFGSPIKLYPSQVSTGSEWSQAGTHSYTDADGVTTTVPTTTLYRVLSTTATAPRSGIGGCVLLRSIRSQEGESDESKWRYFKPGLGFVESTDVDPALDQSAARGTYLVPNVG